jgi:ppGpp synthetase/RelA/SpoT-type nucleotidyltranferase
MPHSPKGEHAQPPEPNNPPLSEGCFSLFSKIPFAIILVMYLKELKMNKPSKDEILKYYDENLPLWEDFLKKIVVLIEDLLKTKGVYPQGVVHRAKSLPSFEKKCDAYDDPFNEITDKCGIRIITYTLDDVEKVSNIIESELDIRECTDKSKEFKANEFGYSCKHYIVKLDVQRAALSEYAKYAGLCVEIQIPTVLQHAWAEIEHGLNYKSASQPPKEIQRKLFRLAAVLELADKEFGEIVGDIEEYKQQVKADIQDNKEVEINSISLMEFMKSAFNEPEIAKTFNGYDAGILVELGNFGIKTISELNNMITPELKADLLMSVRKCQRSNNYLGVLRLIMMIVDTKKYFSSSWDGSWTRLSYAKEVLVQAGVDVEYAGNIVEIKAPES